MKIFKRVVLTVILSIITIFIITNTTKASTVKVTGDTLNIRKGPSTDEQVIAMVSKGVECEFLEEQGDWYKIKYKNYTGYISKQYAELVKETFTEKAKEEEAEQKTEKTEPNVIEQAKESTDKTEETIKMIYKKLKTNAKIKILPLVHSSEIGSIKKNEKVVLITQMAGWSYIQTDTINGWVRSNILEETTNNNTANSKTEKNTNNSENGEITQKTAYINEEYVNLRQGAGTNYNIVKVLTLNTEVIIIKEQDGWYQVKTGNHTGYVSKEFVSNSKKVTNRSNTNSRIENREIGVTEGEEISEIIEQTEKINKNTTTSKAKNTNEIETKQLSTSSKSSQTSKVTTNTTKGEDIVAYAKKYLGNRYVYGGNGSNGTFDCSGFTMYVFKHFGVDLPHGATSQYKSGKGTKITKQSQLQTGDIVFLTDYQTGKGIGHCGIYISNGDFIHASTTTYTVIISSLNTTYKGRFFAGLRLI